MKKLLALAVVALGGSIAIRFLPRGPKGRFAPAISRRMSRRMEYLMANLPEGSPPKLLMSLLPRLREQNDEIIVMLREQNRLLRDHLRMTSEPPPAAPLPLHAVELNQGF